MTTLLNFEASLETEMDVVTETASDSDVAIFSEKAKYINLASTVSETSKIHNDI